MTDLLSRFPSPPLVLSDFRSCLTIPIRQPLSTWSESNIFLSPEYSNRTGPLRLFGWQKGIFDAFTDPTVQEVVVMTSTQVIKSLFLMCAIAYCIAEDPGPILLVEPKDDAARQFSKRRLASLARDCKILHGKISDSSHDGKNTTLSKDFPGGNLLIVSARTPTDLSQHTIRYLFCDEVDKYTSDVGGSAEKGGEGDPIDLAWRRAMTFGSRRKRVIACSPTVAGLSRISKAFARSDQRRPWVPCPHCATYQVLRMKDKNGYRVKWDTSLAKELQSSTARYHCISCDHPWTELERWQAVNLYAEWRPDKPERVGAGIAGFWVNHLYVPFTWKTVPDLTSEFLSAKDDRQTLKTFVNTVLAEEWVEEGETPDKQLLYDRREPYPHSDNAVIPQRGLFLTAAVDVQDNPPRLEVEVKAWGRNRENWSMGYWVIQEFAPNGQPLPVTSPELWDKLDRDILSRDWSHESGHTLAILVMCIDTGKTPKPVYEFARRHPQLSYSPGTGIRLHAARTVVPIKGTPDELRIISGISKEDAARQRQGVRIISIGTHCAKGEIFDLLRHAKPKPDGSLSGQPSHGCCHFPMYDMQYFDGLTAEVRVVKPNGDVEYQKREARNEPVDAFVYNRGGSALVGIDRFNEAQWQRLEEAVRPIEGHAPTIVAVDTSLTSQPPTPVALPSAPPTPTPSVPSPYPIPPSLSSLSSPSPPSRPRPIRGSFL